LVPGKEFTLTFTAVAYNPTQTPESWHQYVRVWIDWDRNGLWEEDERILHWHRWVDGPSSSKLEETVTETFVVPFDAKLRTTWLRMRISKYWGMKPVGNYTQGECEDYPINIVPEPGTFGMLGVGIAIFAFLKRIRAAF